MMVSLVMVRCFMLSKAHNIWSESTIYSFHGSSDGSDPVGVRYADTTSTLYITTATGGKYSAGTAVSLMFDGTDWVASVLHNFGNANDGANPTGGLILNPDTGDQYGTTAAGGTLGGGTVYVISP